MMIMTTTPATAERPLPGTRRTIQLGIAGGALALCVLLLPRQLCGQGADRLFAGELAAQQAAARAVARAMTPNDSGKPRAARAAASGRSDGQAAIALYQMTILGLGQIVREHPEARDAYLPAMRAAAARMVDPRALGYAAQRWGQHGIEQMRPGEGHAYLGYINLALGMLRAVDPGTPYAALHDRLTAALAERLARSPTGLVETYPGETWPPDVAAVAGSIGLHAAVTGTDRRELLATWAARFTRCAVSASGYLVQRVRSKTCTPIDAPRGSGTALASYFIGFADAALSRRLYEALRTNGRINVLGFSGVREYLDARGPGDGDTNSGPILLGASVGATGWALGAARANGDGEFFRELHRSATAGRAMLGERRLARITRFPELADAMLLAMVTANRIEN
jgi:hypothetical protein